VSGLVIVVGILLTSGGFIVLYFGALGSGHRRSESIDLNVFPARKFDALVRSSQYQLRFGIRTVCLGLPMVVIGLLLRARNLM